MKKKLFNAHTWSQIMKISSIQILMALVLTSATWANTSAQEMLKVRVNISHKESSLRTILSELSQMTGVRITYNSKVVTRTAKASIQATNKPLSAVLEQLLTPKSITYLVFDDQIVLRNMEKAPSPPKTEQPIPQVKQIISGSVTDESGTALPGVSILVKGTQQGTTSDVDGKYELSLDKTPVTLVFSFVGYLKEELVINNQTQQNVILRPDTKALDEIIVVGYGTQRKIETTGSIASVKAEDLNQLPVTNVAQGLQARVSGVQINQNSGAPGGNISVRIRGTNSINGNSEPLYIIDGIQISNSGGINDVSPLSSINPNDIESVEVLKDASASAIYGSRAANGVVLITTKRGKAGATKVSFESYYGVQEVSKKMDVLNASQFAQLENEVFKNNYYTDPASLGEGVNWQDLIFRKAAIQNHQLTISGGSPKTQMSLSLNYFNQDGIIINSGFKRFSYRLNLDHQVNDKLKVGTSLMGSFSDNNGINAGSTNIGDASVVTSSVLGAAIGAPPTLQPYREDGSIFPFAEQGNGQYREVINPLNYTSILQNRNSKRALINVYGDYAIAPGLNYRASFNADVTTGLNDSYSPISIIAVNDRNDNSGSASKYNSNSLNLLHESILTYAKTFAGQHSLKFTGLYAFQSQKFNSNTLNASGFPNDATQNEAMELALNRTVSSYRSLERLDSYMGRVNYGFKERYFLDLTARMDGSSKFGANHKYGFFPAISAAWRIIEEPFLQDVSWLTDLKLRASYGITGNAGGISPYNSLATVSSGGGYNFNNAYQTAIRPSGIANPDLRWEKSAQSNFGLDISLLKNRVSVIIDLYHKRTNDLLYIKTLPLSSGYASITGNYGSLENKGFEFATNAVLIDGPLKWTVNGNFTVNRNKVLDLDGGTTDERFITNYTILKVGQPLGMFKTYVFDGINQTGEAILPGYDGRLGGHKVKDLNDDGVINSSDQTITGNPNPKFIYGFSTNLAYKNFDFAAFFAGSYGNDILNASRLSFENPLGQRNLYAGVVDRWTPDNPSNQYVSPLVAGRLPISNYPVEDGSYLRCKNLMLGYTIPNLKSISRLRVYVSANNLFTFTKYTGFDPGVNTHAGSNTTIGIDNLVYPQAKSILGGLQLTF
ncbi:TonB-linked SusC/RagA family outer membrane protein [Dyadobacter jejuensis]|uniref:TonB-linked SusC/RagA family outer membrane protein n=1 Tax=Dyadobacter jejuensis TaxID=1082580 RepID=A0A316AP29_9BACT|nr:TonB-dependent receptor [Dyadobacter jejuensis]PWJ59176.1 TonB-linked SusC/RagA family outer membrane protein [Dyadobacter jejuensis]